MPTPYAGLRPLLLCRSTSASGLAASSRSIQLPRALTFEPPEWRREAAVRITGVR
ncbi:MAG: hypothetical protein ACHBNF_08445 [Chromatiales bacterium]